jgi:hypothetical protein
VWEASGGALGVELPFSGMIRLFYLLGAWVWSGPRFPGIEVAVGACLVCSNPLDSFHRAIPPFTTTAALPSGPMRSVHLIAPVVALVLVGGWLSLQRQALGSVEKEYAELQARIAAAESSGAEGNGPVSQSEADRKPVNWKLLSRQLSEMRHSGDTGDPRPLERFLARVETMTAEELVDALAEIASWKDSGSAAASLESIIIKTLLQKDPELVFTKFATYLRTDRETIGLKFCRAFQKWAEHDLEKATAWFDGQIAAGNFDSNSLDGKSHSRSRFESGLFHVLLSSDVEAAFKRLATVGAEQRGEVLEGWEMSPFKQESQQTFMKLARAGLSEDQVSTLMARQSRLLVSATDFSGVSAFLDRASATAAERTGCVEAAVGERAQMIFNERKITRDDLDAIRQWVSTQAPDSTDRITGQVLVEFTRESHSLVLAAHFHALEFAEAAELAARYHEGADSDDVLCSFLKSHAAQSHKEQARVLAEMIRDGKRQAEILKLLE